MGGGGDSSNFEHGMVCGPRHAVLRISQIADALGFPTQPAVGFTENNEISNKQQVSGLMSKVRGDGHNASSC